jgi:hypothetical protein
VDTVSSSFDMAISSKLTGPAVLTAEVTSYWIQPLRTLRLRASAVPVAGGRRFQVT